MTQATLFSPPLVMAFLFLMAVISGAIPLSGYWRDIHLKKFIAFGAGVLLSTALLFMLPEAMDEVGDWAGLMVLLGFLTFYILEKYFVVHPCPEEECTLHTGGWAAFVGFSVHNFVDGVALGSSFLVPEMMLIVLFALAAHHGPTSFAFTSILKAARYSRRRIVILLLIFAGMVPLGATSSYVFLTNTDGFALGLLISFSSGMFIHLATCDILPQIHKDRHTRTTHLGAFLLGIAIMVALFLTQNHTLA